MKLLKIGWMLGLCFVLFACNFPDEEKGRTDGGSQQNPDGSLPKDDGGTTGKDVEALCKKAAELMCGRVEECGMDEENVIADCAGEFSKGCLSDLTCEGVTVRWEYKDSCLDSLETASCDELFQGDAPPGDCGKLMEGECKEECGSSDECAPGEQCIEGKCVPMPPPCMSDRDCPPDTKCKDGVCVGPQCESSDECPEGQKCVGGTCIPVGPQCRDDRDCPEGYACRNEVCVITGEPCYSDEDCGPEMACIAGQCVSGAWCRSDEDCWPGSKCIEGTCLTPSCQNDRDCEEGLRCINGSCIAQIECSTDWDCAYIGGFMCKDGMCVPNDRIEPVCTDATKEMCRRFFECFYGSGELPWRTEEDCVAETRSGCIGDSACPGVIFHADQAQRCIDAIVNASCEELMQEEGPIQQECSNVTEGECRNQCESDWDCEFGQRCENGQCVQAFCSEDWECREGEQCRDGVCQAAQWCNSDRDCPPDQSCVNGQCRYAQPCGSNQDCPEGQQCINGQCQSTQWCRTDRDCPLGQRCMNGQCMSTGCQGDWDCPEGQSCINGQCQFLRCASDTDCEEGLYCAEGRCARDPCYGVICPVGFVCDRDTGGCVEQGTEQFCHRGTDCPADSLCAMGIEPGSNGVCVKKPAEDASAFITGDNGEWQQVDMDLSCFAQQPQEPPGTADVSGTIVYIGSAEDKPSEYKVAVSLLESPENPVMELMVTGDTFTAANMPTGTALVFKVYAEGLADTYLWDVTIKAASPSVELPALGMFQFLGMIPEGHPLPESSGLIMGQVFDCAGATIKGATASAAPLDGGLAYFVEDADWTVDTGLAATTANGRYMGYGAVPGPAVTAAIARVNGSVGSLGFKNLTIFPVAATFVRFGK